MFINYLSRHLWMRYFAAAFCHFPSHHIMQCHVMLCYVVSCHFSYCVILFHIVSFCVMLCCHIMLCHVVSSHVMSCNIWIYYAMLYHVISRHIKFCCILLCWRKESVFRNMSRCVLKISSPIYWSTYSQTPVFLKSTSQTAQECQRRLSFQSLFCPLYVYMYIHTVENG